MPLCVKEQVVGPGFEIKTETAYRSDLGLALAGAHWGKKVTQSPEVAKATGFSTLYQSDFDIPLHVRRDHALQVAASVLKESINLQGWAPGGIASLAIACTNGWDEHFLPEILDRAGMAHLQIGRDVEVTSLACNSGARALQKKIMHGDPVPTIVFSIDDMTGQAAGLEAADDLSWTIFSNGVAALAFIPGETLTHLQGSDLLILPDTKKALSARVGYPYQNWPLDEAGRYHKTNSLECVELPKPDNPLRLIDMHGQYTGRLFYSVAKLGTPIVTSPDFPQVDHWVTHQPSVGMADLALRPLPGVTSEWFGLDGNSSGTTIFFSLLRTMDRLMPGQNVGFLGFGAGASMTIEVAKLVEAAS